MTPLLLEAWRRRRPIHGARLETDHVERAGRTRKEVAVALWLWDSPRRSGEHMQGGLQHSVHRKM